MITSFFIQHKNLGLPTTLHIGHDGSGLSPNWSVDYVIVRNEVTGYATKYVKSFKSMQKLVFACVCQYLRILRIYGFYAQNVK